MKNKETNKKHLQTNQTSPTPKPNKPKTSLSQILECSLLRHQIRTFSQERSSLQQAGPHAACSLAEPWLWDQLLTLPHRGWAEKGPENVPACWPSPSPGPIETGTAWGRRLRAQSHLPNGLFQKVKEEGPEQPYTKYSVASSKGCTEFLALRSTECVSLLRVPSPQPRPPGSPQQGRGLALNPPPNTPSLGRVQRKT